MVKHILYATDFSDTAENAFPHALTMGILFDAKLTLLNIRVPLQDDPNNPEFQFPELKEIYRRTEKIAEEILKKRAEGEDKILVNTRVCRGIDADSAILSTAADLGAELIVMGTHGRRGVDHLILGSVTNAVIRKTPVCVYTVRRDVVSPDPELPYRRILVPVDLSPGSASSIETALDIARRVESRITLLHVAEEGEGPKAQNQIDKLMKPFKKNDITPLVLEGNPEEMILKVARAESIDLMVMARRGHSLLDYVMMGSTTERMIRTAPCPVISVPV